MKIFKLKYHKLNTIIANNSNGAEFNINKADILG